MLLSRLGFSLRTCHKRRNVHHGQCQQVLLRLLLLLHWLPSLLLLPLLVESMEAHLFLLHFLKGFGQFGDRLILRPAQRLPRICRFHELYIHPKTEESASRRGMPV